MINIIWVVFVVLSIGYGVITGNAEHIIEQILNSGNDTVKLLMKLGPLICIWVGIMRIGEKSGLLDKLALFLSPVFAKVFPSIPKGDKAISLIASNVVVNMFGLGNAATPFGLKAMKRLDELNNHKKTASDAMITFMVINTCGITIVPTTVIAMRSLYHSSNPAAIIIPSMIATTIALTSGLLIDAYIRSRKR